MFSSLLSKLGIGFAAGLCFTAALAFTAALVAITLRICRRHGWVVKPRSDRWHQSTPAFFGGVPIWVALITLSAVVVPWSDHLLWKLLGISSLVFFLGLIDDIYSLRPRTKFLSQLIAAALVLGCGVMYPLRAQVAFNIVFSMIWIVGIINAFNLLDNMDGLSAGVGLISAVYLVLFYAASGSFINCVLVALVAGCLAGFLVFNFNPARIFMGDSGSLFIGFLLAIGSLLDVTHVSGVPALVFAPVIMLAIPIFDTFFVSVTRRIRGQPVSQGGTDHSSHRLVRLGLNERNAVLLLYVLTAASGAIALTTRQLRYPIAVGLMGCWFLFLLLFGIHLFRSGMPGSAIHEHKAPNFLRRLLVPDALAFLLDPVALSLSYYLAYFLRFRADVPRGDLSMFLHSWPIVLATKFFCLWLCKTYQRSWWRGSTSDGYRLARAILIGEVLSVVLLTGLDRFGGYSRLVFVLDAVFSWLLLLGVRRSFPLFRESMYSWVSGNGSQRRVFVLGTSEHAEFALRFLRGRHIACAGLIDTNGGGDLGRLVWGAKVIGKLDDLARLASTHGVSEVVLPEDEPVPYSESDFHDYCRRSQLQLIKLGLYRDGSATTLEPPALEVSKAKGAS